MTELIKETRHLLRLIIDDTHFDKSFNITRLIYLAEKNDLMLALGRKMEEVFSYDSNLLERYTKQKALESNSIKIMEKLLALSASNNLSMTTIKTFLPFRYADNNIDIVVVGHHSMSSVRKLLADLGFARWYSLADIREPRKEMYYQVERGRHERMFPKLHLHSAISWNGIVYLDKQIVWDRHIMTKCSDLAIPIPSPADELLIMAAHAIFENKFITLSEFIHLYLLENNNDIDWNHVIRTATDKNWKDALVYFLANIKQIAQVLEVSVLSELDLPPVKLIDFNGLPYKLPMRGTSKASWKKLWFDVKQWKISELPRQLFSYTLVDWFWMYRKARRKTTMLDKNL